MNHFLKNISIAGGLLQIVAFAPEDARAEARHYTIDSAHTRVSFEVRALGIVERGSFDALTGSVVLDSDAATGQIDIVIDARSLHARNAALERLIRGRSFLNVDRYPEMAYDAQQIVFFAGKPDAIDGELTLHGVTRSIPLRVIAYVCTSVGVQQECMMEAHATLRRSAFGMTRYRSLAADEMQLSIRAEGILAEANAPASHEQ